MKLCKKIISLILAVLMATSALTVVDFSAYADYKNGETSADFDTDDYKSASVNTVENSQIYKFNGHTYQVINETMNWKEAKAY